METVENPQLQLAFDFVEQTGTSLFLTGKAGTGKTTFLHTLKKRSPKRMIVVAPTGVAAINAGGVTIHSFFQLPFGPRVPGGDHGVPVGAQKAPRAVHRFSRNKIAILKSLDLLVIDEISMVRADLLDGVDEVLRRFRDRDKPFGGVQLLMIGDLHQLAPVVKDDEWRILKDHYETVFFFSSRALRETRMVTIELKHIYRQSDAVFIDLLNKVRQNELDAATLSALNKRYLPDSQGDPHEGYITLTTHNYQAVEINRSKLATLKENPHTNTARVEGDFPEYSYPTDHELTLKKGAQVMFVKNDGSREKLFYNGKIGTVTAIHDDIVVVECGGDPSPIQVECVTWQNTRYTLDAATKAIQEEVTGSFTQYPLKLAWAITIHKSQGLTFEKAIIDAGAAFAHGQVYVALSRCKTLDGLVLSSPITSRCVKNDLEVSRFAVAAERDRPDAALLENLKTDYQQALLMELFDFEVVRRKLFHCMKLVQSNRAVLQESDRTVFDAMGGPVENDLFNVSLNFKNELRQLLAGPSVSVEENAALQSRVEKACAYFSARIETLFGKVPEDLEIVTDNTVLRKSLERAIGELREIAAIKIRCLKACRPRFSVKAYLAARALAAIESPEKKPRLVVKKGSSVQGSSAHPGLFDTLKAWRNEKAVELALPAYMVVQQKTLYELADRLPCSLDDLLKIKGIGKRKAERFGDEIIAMIRAFCGEKRIEKRAGDDIPEVRPPDVPLSADSKRVSLALHRSGMSIEEIAAHRGMAVSTIEGHLAFFVGTSELGLDRLVAPEKIASITDAFLSKGSGLLGPVKETLGDGVTYAELRFVANYLKVQGKMAAK
jgi:hypothetical protein